MFSNDANEYGGGIANYPEENGGTDELEVTNCVFFNNSATSGGGLFVTDNVRKSLTNCTFYDNDATNGGGIYNYCSNQMYLINCIVYGNEASQSGDNLKNGAGWYPVVKNCDIEDSFSGGSWVQSQGLNYEGNIAQDPCFANPSDPNGADNKFGTLDDGLIPASGSPCLDAADDYWAPMLDIGDKGRFDSSATNNGERAPKYTDIGAYEQKQLKVVLMSFTDESSPYYAKVGSYSEPNEKMYLDDLEMYRAALAAAIADCNVKAGCRVVTGTTHGETDTIADVLPRYDDYSSYSTTPPAEIGMAVSDKKSGGNYPDRTEMVNMFANIRDGMVPDYLLID